MSLRALQDYTYFSRYARYLPEQKRRETWNEAIDRVLQMHTSQYPQIQTELEWAADLSKKRIVLGSQRILQFGGPGVLAHNCRGYNCATIYIDKPISFQHIMYLFLCGTGVGFSVQKHHIEQLPNFTQKKTRNLKYQIPDSIEGWSDSIGILISSYLNNGPFPEYSESKVEFDYSLIRPKGAALSSSSGKAPGPEPLFKAHEQIRAVLNSVDKIRPIQAYDIIMYIADAVLSGGVRRTASAAIFSHDDEEMIQAKTGGWMYENPQRGRSNNSAMLIYDEIDRPLFDRFAGYIKQYGEPGFVLSPSKEILYNPCLSANSTVWIRHKNEKDCTGSYYSEIGTIGELKEGDFIWSETGWTQVLRKWCTGTKKVYKYITDYHTGATFKHDSKAFFLGTDNHQVVCRGQKIQIKDTNQIDVFEYNYKYFPGLGDYLNDITIHTANIVDIQYVGEEDVFDITVDNEPHTFWTGGCNVSNCFEAGMMPKLEDGRTGVQFCNLCEINGKKIKSVDDWRNAVKAAAILGTAQAGYTSFPYLGSITEEITRREALLGISITGIMDSPEILLNPKLQREMAEYAREINKEIALKIGINPSARTTNLKPAGSTSCILGTSSGIHPHHAKRYIRRVQANKMEDVFQYFSNINPVAVEESVWSNNKTDCVLSFCIEVPDGAKTKNQVPALELLKNVKLTQENWVEGGTDKERCVYDRLRHNVSNTITVKDDEWNKVLDYIYKHRDKFAAVSMLPDSGDKDYPQAPFTAVYTPTQMLKEYGDGCLFCSGLIERASIFWSNLWFACDSLLGKKPIENQGQEEWVKAATKFANKYFDGNTKKLTYCMKDVFNWKKWLDLNREYKDVDYTGMIEEQDNTNPMEEVSCAGGACSLI